MTVYSIFAFLDYAIYSMVSFIVKLIVLIANANFFNETAIEKVADKVYIILGVLVLFKIVVSCVQYMVNPDTFDDKDKGMTGILKKAVISMALLAVIRPIFQFAMDMQTTIVATIPDLILSNTSGGSIRFSEGNQDNVSRELEEIGEKVSGSTLWTFAVVKKQYENNIDINSIDHTVDNFRTYITKNCNQGLDGFVHTDKCYFEYRIVISTAAGIFLLYILASLALEVGIRTIKLGIIQMLAPIPISSYIVSKDKLSKFVKLATKVYLDLFIRLGVIYFIVFFVREVIDSIGRDKTTIIANYIPSDFETAFIKVIIIIALFMFAKNAPKFICEVLGIDGGGFGDMKDMFTRGAGLAGSTFAGLRTARSNYTAEKERTLGKNPNKKVAARLRGAISAAAGMGSATGRGLVMAAQGKGFKDVRQNASSAALKARKSRTERVDKLYNKDGKRHQYAMDENGNRIERKVISKIPGIRNLQWARYQREKNPEYYGWLDYHRDVRREKLEIPSSEGFVKARYDAMEGIAKMAADAKAHGVGKMNETPNKYQISLASTGQAGASIQSALSFETLSMEQVRNMYQMAKNGQTVKDKNGNDHKFTDAEINDLGTLVQSIEKRTSYLKEAELMATGDPAATPNAEKLRIALQTNRDMFSSEEIMQPIREKLLKDIGSTTVVDGETYDISKLDYKGLLKITEHLQDKINATPGTDAYNDEVDMRADILLGIKDSFEEVAKKQYRGAQIADNRAQKAQQAISNNDKKG